jgi:MFS family permease
VTQSLLPVGLISLVFNLGGGLTSAALPLYARELGADYRDLGLIGASHGIAFALLTVPLGRASDRLGRRRLLLFSTLAVGAAAAVYLLATHVPGLIAGKLLEALGWAAFWPALEAWVAESFGRRAGTAIGVGYGAYAAAYVVGTSTAGFVIEAAGVRIPFAMYLGTALATLPLVLVLTRRDAAPDPHPGGAPAGWTPGPDPEANSARQQRALAYATGFVYVFGLGTVLAFLPVYAVDRGLSPRAVGLLLAGYWMARLLSAFNAGRLSDRWGRRAILVPALSLSAAAALLMAMPAGPAALFVGTAGLGVAAGACGPACVGHLADHVRPADRGVVMGMFEGACGVSFIVAGFVGGHTAEAFGPDVPYVLVAALALGWAAVLARRLPRGPVRLAA